MTARISPAGERLACPPWMDTLSHYLTKLRTSLLAVPMLMAVVAIALAQAMLALGQPADWPLPRWLHAGSPGAARDLLGSLLTGIITMFSLVLSVTMVVLTLAAQQIGSRLIRTFIDDRVTQSVIGLFLGAMLYLLVVLAAVDETAAARVPQPAVALGMVLAVLCMVALILYVDKLARSIVFDHAAARMSQEVERVCEHLRKDPGCEESSDGWLPPDAMRLMQDAGQQGESLSLGATVTCRAWRTRRCCDRRSRPMCKSGWTCVRVTGSMRRRAASWCCLGHR
jgi:uncharacterized membrane protein